MRTKITTSHIGILLPLILTILSMVLFVSCDDNAPVAEDLYFSNIHVSRLYIDDASTYLDSNGGDIVASAAAQRTLVVAPPAWNEIIVSMTNVPLPAALPPTDMPYVSSHVPAFDPNATNVIYFSIQLPHDYLESSDIKFHIHIVYPDAGAGDSVWYFTYSWANVGDAFPAFTSATVVTTSTGVADEQDTVEIAAINGAGKQMSSMLLCSIQRSGALLTDTYANYVYLLSCDFCYQTDTIGSRQEAVK
jgi:hypothetical protein